MFTKIIVTTSLAAVAAACVSAATLLTVASPADISAAQQNPPLRVRKNIDELMPNELANLRHAFAKVIEIGLKDQDDKKGYVYWARIHHESAVGRCVHLDQWFMPWHRWYLLEFENVLRAADPQNVNTPTRDVTIPYWDWTAESKGAYGYPSAVEEPFVDPVVKSVNSLYWPNAEWCKVLGPLVCGERNKYPKGQIPYNKKRVLEILAEPWPKFAGNGTNGLLETEAHGDMHVKYIGSAMAIPRAASNDPLFWFMHANVDRLLQTWQIHKQVTPCDARYSNPWPMLNDYVAKPPANKWPDRITVGQTVCIDTLGYKYDKLHDVPLNPYPPVVSGKDFTLVAPPRDGGQLAPQDSSLRIPYVFTVPAKAIKNAYVIIPGVTTPKQGAYQLRVYLHPRDEDYDGGQLEFANRYYAGQTTVWALGHLQDGKPVDHQVQGAFVVSVAEKLNQVIKAAPNQTWAAAVAVTRLGGAADANPLAKDSRPFIEIVRPTPPGPGPDIPLTPVS